MTRAVLLLALVGCVPKGKHEITTVQLSATRMALSAQVQRCATDQTASDQRIAELEAEIALRQAQLDEIAARHALDEHTFDAYARQIVEAEALIRALRAERDRLAALVPKRAVPAPAEAPPPDPDLAGRLAAALEDSHAHDVDTERVAARKAEVVAAFAPLVAQGRAQLLTRGDGIVVRIRTSLLFQEGFVTLSPRGSTIVADAAEALRSLPGRRVVVEGHTDDRPLHTAEWPSNWERGFSRAAAVLRALEAAGVPEPMSAASYAATRPVVPHGAEGATDLNDRVELYVDMDPALPRAFQPTPVEEPPEQPTPIPTP